MLQLRLVTLGVATAQGPIRPVPRGRPLGALIFLSLQPQYVDRQELADILWDAGSLRSERHSLSQLLYALRQCLPAHALVADANRVGIEPEAVSADYNDFFRAFGAKDYAAVTSIYRGGFLTGPPLLKWLLLRPIALLLSKSLPRKISP
jgi:hypothetical protein